MGTPGSCHQVLVTWYQVLGTKCFALSPWPTPPPAHHHGLPSQAILINNVDFKYCVPRTCVPVVPGVQYARSHVGLDKLHFAPLSLQYTNTMLLRVVHPCELETCTCRTVLHVVLVRDEDRPRCFECVKPIRNTGSAALHLRWLQLAVLLVGATEQDSDDTASDTTLEITGTMAPSHALPAGFIAPPTRLYELSEPWWKTPMRLWPAFRKLRPEEYKALIPPCWLTVHDAKDWHKCELCRVEFMRRNGQNCPPSSWICRCGDHDLLWFHKVHPSADEHCRPCMEAMRADGIDHEMWGARVKRERDQLIVEQCTTDKPLMKDMRIFDTSHWTYVRQLQQAPR